MELESLLTLIEKVSSSSLDEFDYDDGTVKLGMKKKKKEVFTSVSGAVSELPKTFLKAESVSDVIMEEELPEGKQVKAPLVGTFYNASSPDADPFVSVGDTVKKGQILGIIEAMKLMNEIECECDGVVESILAESGQMVEYGQPLFVIK